MGARARRLVSVAFAAAVFGAACGSDAVCEGGDELIVAADATCPSRQAAEEALRTPEYEPSVDGLSGTLLIEPVTLCWYRATWNQVSGMPDTCNHRYTRDHWVALKTPPAREPPGYALSCDGDGLLYGAVFVEPVATPSEAAAATPYDCPVIITPDADAVESHGGLEVAELVGSDFFPAQKACFYDTHRPCGSGCGAPSGGLR